MTEVADNDAASGATPDDPDLVTSTVKIGNNKFHAGTRIPNRPNDDSLRPKQRQQRPVPPDSLLWKYMGDLGTLGATGQRAAITENMWPQLGQGVSDHSVLVSRGDLKSLRERAANTMKTIGGVLYGPPDAASKYGVQIRNFHKSIKGDMPNGRKYHAIDSETFYWAHVTFFELIYRTAELGVYDLSRDEKEQIFEESKFWFSMYGVDDRAQPETYAEFETYLADVKANQLIDMGIAQYTAGSAKTPDYMFRAVPARYRRAAKLTAPALAAILRITTMGHLEPELLERLRLTDYWTLRDRKRYRRLLTMLRFYRTTAARLHLPISLRYAPFAVTAFRREGINPDDITLDSARAALAKARRTYADGIAADQIAITGSQVAPTGASCAKCERTLENCEECDAAGTVEGEPCDVCNGAQRGCPVHHADWREAAVI
ncbi:oxygenase MpaB family protein [Gordonia sp. CPCC 205333]|uniref:oxygenase MpaB family protein n=1 Tax=Gordonia sp. CPCC 205333 TaxID=3140790 RepID=UPI003AF3C69E